jgi:hypothetical protein
MQDAKAFEKQAKSDFSKTCGLRLRHTSSLSAESMYRPASRVKLV